MSHGKAFKVLAPRSKFYQGPFGRICPDLPAWVPEVESSSRGISNDTVIATQFIEFANDHMLENQDPKRPRVLVQEGLDRSAEGDSSIPAGYTYFGQFIDHDVTFDPASSLMRQNDPSGLLNHRTPRLDLDNLYGRGPGADSHLYQKKDKAKFLIGTAGFKVMNSEGETVDFTDLPRSREEIALIGDPRNDENAIVSQLQLAFLLAHNRLVDVAREKYPDEDDGAIFERARTSLRWLYQYLVWNDFLRRVSDQAIHAAALTLDSDPIHQWNLGLKEVYNWKVQPFIPVEFSVAAYRFGHTMVRNSYRTNFKHGNNTGDDIFIPIFDNSMRVNIDDLRGSQTLNLPNTVQWDWFLNMTSSRAPDFPQKARRLDTQLANALGFLHEMPLDEAIQEPRQAPINFLAFRNLMRGYQFALPAGTAVAKKFSVDPVPLDENDIDALWYYILKEAAHFGGGNHLGKVGSIIVCATFAGLLKGDPNAYLNIDPRWHPSTDDLLSTEGLLPTNPQEAGMRIDQDPFHIEGGATIDLQDEEGRKIWTLGSIIRLSRLPIRFNDLNPAGMDNDAINQARS